MTATAVDNIGVVGVQFKVDGVNTGAEDPSAPYTYSWNTTTATNVSHTLTAVARDAAGNTASAPPVAVIVNNTTTPPPTLTFSASPTTITAGQASTLSWSSTNATSCTASGPTGWSGTKATSGTQSVSPTVTTAYSLTCTGLGGSVTKSANVTVTISIAPLQVTLSSASGRAGQTVTVSLSQISTPARNTSTLSTDITYDTTRLTLATYANGSAIEANEFALVDVTSKPGTISVVISDLAAATDPIFGLQNGELLRLTFTINATTPTGAIPLPLTPPLALDKNGQGITSIVKTDGAITVTP